MSEKTELARKEKIMPERSRDIPAVAPLVDIYENDEELLLRTDLPGVEKKDITVNIDNGKLTLSGARKQETKGSAQWIEFGSVEYLRTFSVPQTIDVEKIKAELNNGVLNLHMPKSAAAKPRKIEIKAG